MPSTLEALIYSSQNIRVYITIHDTNEDLLVITFSNWEHKPSFGAGNSGKSYLMNRKFNNIHIACNTNKWYQFDDMKNIEDICRPYLVRFSNVVNYGSSMGGYAALLFSKALRATRVVAIAPQYSIDSNKIPWETRWRREASDIDFVIDDMDRHISRCATIFVLYDPFFLNDRLHVDQIRKTRPVNELKFPFSGHSVSRFLLECNLLVDLITELLKSGQVIGHLRERVRAGRKSSNSYMIRLANSLKDRRPIDSEKLARIVKERLNNTESPSSIGWRRELAWLYWDLGNKDQTMHLLNANSILFSTAEGKLEAETVFQQDIRNLQARDERVAVALAKNSYDSSLASKLEGDVSNAIAYAKISCEAVPSSKFYRRYLGDLYFNTGFHEGAIEQFTAILCVDETDLYSHCAIIQLLTSTGRYDLALAQVESAFSFHPRNEWVKRYFMQLLRKWQKPSIADLIK